MNSFLLLAIVFFFQAVRSLPVHPLKTWDPEEHQLEEYNLWVERLRAAINQKDWKVVAPKDFIAHDKFNIADGFDVDMLNVEEMQLAGDPVIKVEREMQEKRDKQRKEQEAKNNTKSSSSKWWFS